MPTGKPGAQCAIVPGLAFWAKTAAIALVALINTPSRAEAHALGAECRIKNNIVLVEGFFSDDTPARHAEVQVRESGGRLIAQGRTDEQGRWSFPKPAPGRYLVIMDAGAGHRTQLDINVAPSVVDDTPMSDSPTRAEFTQFSWAKLLLGLVLIAGLAVLGAWYCRRSGSRCVSSGEGADKFDKPATT